MVQGFTLSRIISSSSETFLSFETFLLPLLLSPRNSCSLLRHFLMEISLRTRGSTPSPHPVQHSSFKTHKFSEITFNQISTNVFHIVHRVSRMKFNSKHLKTVCTSFYSRSKNTCQRTFESQKGSKSDMDGAIRQNLHIRTYHSIIRIVHYLYSTV